MGSRAKASSSQICDQEKISRLSSVHRFGIAETAWRKALMSATLDSVAGIKHAELCGDSSRRLHVAEISDKVTCHVHLCGCEAYEIVSGGGKLLSGPVSKTGGVYLPIRYDSLTVKAGDVFNVPENFAHQLVRVGNEPLIIIFACSDSHLGSDRLVLPDMKV